MLTKCPRCFSEARAQSEVVLNLGDDEAAEEHWVACTKCEFSSEPAPTRTEAVEHWTYPQVRPKRDEPVEDEDDGDDFKEQLLNVLQDISKSLKTIATKR